ncbi:PPA1309 family protein [Nocardioides jiangsuensis]|nr:PPA1309 family protein [Nocardioides jiangsuensis]
MSTGPGPDGLGPDGVGPDGVGTDGGAVPVAPREPMLSEDSPEVDPVLQTAVREIEAHAAEAGWDQPSRLYALVPTADLLAREPVLAAAMGLDESSAAGSLTPVEQDQMPAEQTLEQTLGQIMWPAEVFGCAAVVERFVLPPGADEQIPQDPAAAEQFAVAHPERQEVRIVAGATRDGSTYCALRLKSHDDDLSVVESPDLVPALLELLLGTLEQ